MPHAPACAGDEGGVVGEGFHRVLLGWLVCLMVKDGGGEKVTILLLQFTNSNNNP